MVIYKYSLAKDIQHARDNIKYRAELDDLGVIYFPPNPFLWLWTVVWFVFAKKPSIKGDTICYVRSSGPWGQYHDDMSISICPWKLNAAPCNLAGLVKHEIVHLEHPEWDKLPHEEKEANVNKEMLRLSR